MLQAYCIYQLLTELHHFFQTNQNLFILLFYKSSLFWFFIYTTLSSYEQGDQFCFEARQCQRPQHPGNPRPPGRICFLIIFLMEGPVDDCNSGFFKSTLCPFRYLSIVVTPGSCQVPVNGVQMFENVFVVLWCHLKFKRRLLT